MAKQSLLHYMRFHQSKFDPFFRDSGGWDFPPPMVSYTLGFPVFQQSWPSEVNADTKSLATEMLPSG